MTSEATLNPEQWERVQDLFHRASELPELDRAAFVDGECEGEGWLRSAVLSLLAADTTRGMRPSFTSAATPEFSKGLYQYFCQQLRALDFNVPTGIFGADMKVSLLNDGPVTFTLTI